MFAFSIISEIKSVMILKQFMLFLLLIFFPRHGLALYWHLMLIYSFPTDSNVFENENFTAANLCQNPEPVNYFVERVWNHLLSTTIAFSFDHPFRQQPIASVFLLVLCTKRNISFVSTPFHSFPCISLFLIQFWNWYNRKFLALSVVKFLFQF